MGQRPRRPHVRAAKLQLQRVLACLARVVRQVQSPVGRADERGAVGGTGGRGDVRLEELGRQRLARRRRRLDRDRRPQSSATARRTVRPRPTYPTNSPVLVRD